ncbi:RNA polymerase sigma factor [Pelagicoccus sp. NFK12]|uniref:RNA polymerase sigma factor n=1 Tax=Pelagicoccus enzymogenes TaxID=2773457 RepID=A0A927IJY9_9BACT|nr:RNA polymerase sigma factor [Pelagicoccus enzymogenes]MBD5782055.1 RNA polymerase sigma factor [Pelagicoccus enzymogenes]MDQ8196809.1 RNA polymerase sigma factor [Pelagicoccus enzymogenes]
MKDLKERGSWFTEEILPHEERLRKWLRSQFDLRDGVDDVVQEAFMQVYKASEKRPITNPKAYLYSIARNASYKKLKKDAMLVSESFEESSTVVPFEPSKGSDDWVIYQEEVGMLRDAIQRLPKKCRKIFVMRRIQGLSHAEIAERLGISVNTVSAQLTIGLRKCAQFFEKV